MSPKVLLIEDDSAMLALLRTLLRFEGYDVITFEEDDNLDKIINFIHLEQPSAVLLDVHLRQLNGFDLLRAIRQDEAVKHIGVVMSSGIDFSQRCLTEGADHFILKPYMPDELIRKLSAVIGGKNSEN